MAGPFKFGMQKHYRQLNDMDSRKGERKKAETTLKHGITLGVSKASLPTDATQSAAQIKTSTVAAASEVKK